jgi:signal transduction histidine kinase
VNNRGKIISHDKLQTIFDPMVRIAAHVNDLENDDSMERTSLGIGLYISREIVQAHGGKIKVTSNASDGTTFILTMPRLPAGFRSLDPAVGTPDGTAVQTERVQA